MLKSSLMCLVVLVIGLAATAPPASAGAIALYTGSCILETNGNTLCSGSLQGIRNDRADPNSYAWFAVDSNGARTFVMRVLTTTYTCSAPSSMSAIWNNAVNSSGVFSVTISPRGVCTFVRISSESLDKNGPT